MGLTGLDWQMILFKMQVVLVSEALKYPIYKLNAEEKSSFTFEDAMSFVGADAEVLA